MIIKVQEQFYGSSADYPLIREVYLSTAQICYFRVGLFRETKEPSIIVALTTTENIYIKYSEETLDQLRFKTD